MQIDQQANLPACLKIVLVAKGSIKCWITKRKTAPYKRLYYKPQVSVVLPKLSSCNMIHHYSSSSADTQTMHFSYLAVIVALTSFMGTLARAPVIAAPIIIWSALQIRVREQSAFILPANEQANLLVGSDTLVKHVSAFILPVLLLIEQSVGRC
ncbi:hypothetical protein BD769DRAFT_1390408 [Suillus cothurnatus]|nr:hypothetical protein BD769DRAFT_1390408 [Suillus cothurnatus]